ncbi:unnamed protein product [Protopolystoma xenopodis]|uniref:Uncharacterized protein n=1 Tax=Protopolystoma xenopodis TaxID=117903 RepID=A0A448XQ76_9PLAT|nr:unnamed protein product [Protopolystoma xenopodis]
MAAIIVSDRPTRLCLNCTEALWGAVSHDTNSQSGLSPSGVRVREACTFVVTEMFKTASSRKRRVELLLRIQQRSGKSGDA